MNTSVAQDPNIVAAELTGRNYLSYSAISTYQQCPLRYYFKYVAGLPEETVSASLVFGGAIHAAVQHHFEALLAGEPLPSLEDLLAAYRLAWESRDTGEVAFKKGDDEQVLQELALRMLVAFQASHIADPEGRILGIEEELVGELVPGVPDLLARLDLIVETTEAITVTDFKTARSRWSQSRADEAGTQLLLYQELARELVPGKDVRLQFAVLTKGKLPEVEVYPLAADPWRVTRTKQIVERVWRAIAAGNFFPAPSPVQCPTCPFPSRSGITLVSSASR